MKRMAEKEAHLYLVGVRQTLEIKGLRLGQAILNDWPDLGACSEVYYSENEAQVIDWFYANLVGEGEVTGPMDTSMMRVAPRQRLDSVLRGRHRRYPIGE